MKIRAICQYSIENDEYFVRFDVSNGHEQLHYTDTFRVMTDQNNQKRFEDLQQKAEKAIRKVMEEKKMSEDDLIELPIYKEMKACDFGRFDK